MQRMQKEYMTRRHFTQNIESFNAESLFTVNATNWILCHCELTEFILAQDGGAARCLSPVS